MATKSTSSSRLSGRRGNEKCGAHNNEEGGQGQPCPLREAIEAVQRGEPAGAVPLLTAWIEDEELRRQHLLLAQLQDSRGRRSPALPSVLLPPPL